jgi:hypothetical protein
MKVFVSATYFLTTEFKYVTLWSVIEEYNCVRSFGNVDSAHGKSTLYVHNTAMVLCSDVIHPVLIRV